MRLHKILHVEENRKYIPIMAPDLALRLTLISSICPCLEHIFMVPKVFKPYKLAARVQMPIETPLYFSAMN